MSYKELAFIGGAVGYFGYDIGCFIENIPHITIDDVKMPDCFLGFYDGIYIFDHKLPIMYIAVLKFLTKKLMVSGYMTKNTRDSVFAREKISSTEIGNLVALPHPLVNGQKNSAIAILVLTKPIQWDDNMVQVIFLINIEKSLLYLWNTIAVKLYDYLVKNNEVKNLLREQSFTKFFDSFVKMFN